MAHSLELGGGVYRFFVPSMRAKAQSRRAAEDYFFFAATLARRLATPG